jgi:hypothetical protein
MEITLFTSQIDTDNDSDFALSKLAGSAGGLAVTAVLRKSALKKLTKLRRMIEQNYPLRTYRLPHEDVLRYLHVYLLAFSPDSATVVVNRKGIFLYLEPPTEPTEAGYQTLRWKLNI